MLDSSPDRVAVPCAHQLEGCGGCDLLHVAADTQLTMKTAMVIDQLARASLTAPDPSMRTLENDHGRTTIRAAVHEGRAGYRARNSHDIVVADAVKSMTRLLSSCSSKAASAHRRPRFAQPNRDCLVVVDHGAVDVEVPDDVVVVSETQLAKGKRVDP